MKNSKKEYEYKEDLKQVWKRTTEDNTWFEKDQYGYKIQIGTRYSLFHKDELLIKTYSKEAAKLISTILLNDKILCQTNEN